MEGDGSPVPTVWLLSGDKGGDAAQLRLLARALGHAWVEKPLTFNSLYRLPNRVLGASVRSLAGAATAALAPPWPELVLTAGRRTTPVARWIRARSGGRTKLVNVGRPWAPLAAFDLVIATPQYRLPPRPMVMPVRLPFNRIDASVMAAAASDWTARLAGLPPPYLGLLIGGRARPLRFDSEVARDIGRGVDALARELGGSVLAVTSRRTPADAAATLLAEITVPLLAHRWRPGEASNAYPAVLGLADRLVVTGDSASMIAEACRSAKPVSVAPVPLSGTPRERLPRLLTSVLPRHVRDALHAGGWIVLPRDIAAVWRPLARDRHVHVVGEPLVPTTPAPDDMEAAVTLIRSLLAERPAR